MASNEEMDQLLSEAKLESSAEMSSDIVSNVFNDVDSSHETSEASALLSKDRSDSTSFVPVEVSSNILACVCRYMTAAAGDISND